MTPLVTASDVEAVFGPLDEAQTATISGLIEQASIKVYLSAQRAGVEIPALNELGLAAVRAATVNAVTRVLRNPEGLRQFMRVQSAGGYSETESGTLAAGDAARGMYVDPADLPWVRAAMPLIGTARVRGGMRPE